MSIDGAHKFVMVLYTNSIKKIFVKIRAICGFLISHKLSRINLVSNYLISNI